MDRQKGNGKLIPKYLSAYAEGSTAHKGNYLQIVQFLFVNITFWTITGYNLNLDFAQILGV